MAVIVKGILPTRINLHTKRKIRFINWFIPRKSDRKPDHQPKQA